MSQGNFLGAQASLPAGFPAMTDSPKRAGKDACAPRKFALPPRRDF